MELTISSAQNVTENNNLLFQGTNVCGCSSIVHRNNSGVVSLRGLTNQCRARFRITFSGNIAIGVGGTVEPIYLSVSQDGEPIIANTMAVTPAAASEYFNVATSCYIDVPRNCCTKISIKNISNQTISVSNADLIVERVA